MIIMNKNTFVCIFAGFSAHLYPKTADGFNLKEGDCVKNKRVEVPLEDLKYIFNNN